ncbi:hypothetical protein HG531_006118 [Fusarium graminearum]|nr:hypothetical protein HG531_006118 [Fusarium graminearum]
MVAEVTRLVHAGLDVRTALLGRSSSLDNLTHDIVESTNTHASLTVSSESVVASEAVAAFTGIRLDSSVDLGMSLKIVLPDEALLACGTLVLTVVEVSLNVRLDVLLAAELLTTVLVCACPFAVACIGAADELSDLILSHTGLCLGLLNVDTGNAGSTGDACNRFCSAMRRVATRGCL